jgi:hypothetical protein
MVDIDAERERAKQASWGCRYCRGSGIVPLISRIHPNGRASTYCNCAFGEWCRSRAGPDTAKMVHLDAVLAGTTPYWPVHLLEEAEVERS